VRATVLLAILTVAVGCANKPNAQDSQVAVYAYQVCVDGQSIEMAKASPSLDAAGAKVIVDTAAVQCSAEYSRIIEARGGGQVARAYASGVDGRARADTVYWLLKRRAAGAI